jgi:hypothetical protein
VTGCPSSLTVTSKVLSPIRTGSGVVLKVMSRPDAGAVDEESGSGCPLPQPTATTTAAIAIAPTATLIPLMRILLRN